MSILFGMDHPMKWGTKECGEWFQKCGFYDVKQNNLMKRCPLQADVLRLSMTGDMLLNMSVEAITDGIEGKRDREALAFHFTKLLEVSKLLTHSTANVNRCVHRVSSVNLSAVGSVETSGNEVMGSSKAKRTNSTDSESSRKSKKSKVIEEPPLRVINCVIDNRDEITFPLMKQMGWYNFPMGRKLLNVLSHNSLETDPRCYFAPHDGERFKQTTFIDALKNSVENLRPKEGVNYFLTESAALKCFANMEENKSIWTTRDANIQRKHDFERAQANVGQASVSSPANVVEYFNRDAPSAGGGVSSDDVPTQLDEVVSGEGNTCVDHVE